MKYRKQILLALTVILMGACSMPKGPVPLSSDVPEANGWETEIVIDGLSSPWAVTWLPDTSDTVLITEKTGNLRKAVNYELAED